MKDAIRHYEELLEKADSLISAEYLKIAPTNIDGERKKFLASSSYQPKFRYRRPANLGQIRTCLKNLSRIRLPDAPISHALMEKASQLTLGFRMAAAIGGANFSQTAIDYFGLPSSSLLRRARGMLKQPAASSPKTAESSVALEVAKDCILQFGLEGWRAEYKPIVTLAMVHGSKRRIYVREGALVPTVFLKRMIVHEVGTHAFRSYNGSLQPYRIFSSGFPAYLSTEEGLAANVEEMHGCLDAATLRGYAGRVLAVHLSSSLGFREAYDRLLPHFSEQEAWQLVLRAKRGTPDASRKGCYPKDHAYLKGYFEVKKFLGKHGRQGLVQLFHGKIGLQHTSLLKDIEGLQAPRLLPTDPRMAKLLGSIK